jgi:hypothetical protein
MHITLLLLLTMMMMCQKALASLASAPAVTAAGLSGNRQAPLHMPSAPVQQQHVPPLWLACLLLQLQQAQHSLQCG